MKKTFHRKWNNSSYQWRKEVVCFFSEHKWVRHYTGKKIQMGAEAPVGREVDYYYCERCEVKDPERNTYTNAKRAELAPFYVN